jgi:hypothetical protein
MGSWVSISTHLLPTLVALRSHSAAMLATDLLDSRDPFTCAYMAVMSPSIVGKSCREVDFTKLMSDL